MTEKKIKCIECGSTFVISEAEQQYFVDKGFAEPKRCNLCRTKRRNQRMRQNETGIYRPQDNNRGSSYQNGGYQNSNYPRSNYQNSNYGRAGGENTGESGPQIRYYYVKCFSCGSDTKINYRPSYSDPAVCSGCNQGRYRKRRY